ncbi:GntR family transcriptional regulator [Streptomyces graminilatus]|uniref:GntR family transcriptional regulator n=1 Tax=Streptomyces graminilatus TaxID=1464070 RepID=UPI0012FE9184|nr:GntR family transcriptional regulator [Streptomyces graminilatus]
MTTPHPHERAAAALRRDILDGTFGVGGELPGGRELAARYGVARDTVARALGILQAEGFVEKAPRRKARVLRPAPPLEARLHEDGLVWPAETGGLGYNDLRSGGRGTDPRATEALSLATSAPLHVRQAVLLHGGAPWALQTLLTPQALKSASVGRAATVGPFTDGPLREETRYTSSWSARLATPEERGLLRAQDNAAVMEIQRVGFTKERPTSYLLTVVRSDRSSIRMDGPI